jgi:hypothetical protein
VKASLLAVFAVAGCTTQYAYTFQVVDPGVVRGPRDVVETATVKAALAVDGDVILLDLTNKTSEVLQVRWADIAIDRGDGSTTRLHPIVDLGWVQPGATATAQLVPFALPHSGDEAYRYEGRHFDLAVPVIANRESTTYHFHFVAHVHSL